MAVRRPEWHSRDVSTKGKVVQLIIDRPDIYIFDDVMSALDGKVGAFITEETIMKQLKGKTVILVTHGLQYLKYSDYIYVMDQGEIVEQGEFDQVKDTELYQKFIELDEVTLNLQTKN